MKSAVVRVRACLICQGRLPAGSRIDRQYCGQACSDRAYYLRHPDKKRVLTARTRKAAESETRVLRQAGEAARKLAQLEADNAALRRQLESAQKQIVDLRAAVSTSMSRAPAPDPAQAAALKAANQKIESLTAELHQVIDDAVQADEQLRDAHKEIEELKRQLINANYQLERAGQVVQNLTQRLRQPTHAAPAPATPPVHAPRQSNAAPQPAFRPHAAPNPVREPLPWERPSERFGESPIPRWMGMPDDNFAELREFSDETLQALPSEIYKRGERKDSQIMRDWLNRPENSEPLREFSFLIILLTLSTTRSQRRNGAQRKSLEALVLDNAIKTMEIDAPVYAHEIKDLLATAVGLSLFDRLVFELVDACRGKELLHNEQRGTWRFFVRAPQD